MIFKNKIYDIIILLFHKLFYFTQLVIIIQNADIRNEKYQDDSEIIRVVWKLMQKIRG